MTLMQNEMGELYNPADFDPPKPLAAYRRKERKQPPRADFAPKPPASRLKRRTCEVCGGPLPKGARSNRRYCSDRCRNKASNMRKAKGK